MYSANSASVQWASLFPIAFFLFLGGAWTFMGLRKKHRIELLGGIAVVFAVAAMCISNVRLSLACANAAATGNAEILEGKVLVTDRFSKPGYGTVTFRIAGRTLTTAEAGISLECGYLVPAGKVVRIADGMRLSVAVFDDRIVLIRPL